MTVPGAQRLTEAREGIAHLRTEIDGWIAAASARGPAGAHLTRLDTLRTILRDTLDLVAADADGLAPDSVAAAYVAALRLDRRVLFCRRLLRWYVLRFDQRAEPAVRTSLLAADEVVWSVWAQTFGAAQVERPAAPLCFVDDDPVPWASFHDALPGEARPPSQDPLLSKRIRALPVPVIGLPPLVARRPWWLVTAVHEVGHHVQHALGVVDSIQASLQDAARKAEARPAEALQWAEWSGEVYADVFAAVFAGTASVWAITELERTSPDWLQPRSTYPPALVRLELAAAAAHAEQPAEPAPDPTSVKALRERIPAIVAAVLDHPLGATTLRALASEDRAYDQARWAAELRDDEARPVAQLGAAEACVAGAVRVWRDDAGLDPATLRTRLLGVLPLCRPDGTRASERDSTCEAAAALAAALTNDELG